MVVRNIYAGSEKESDAIKKSIYDLKTKTEIRDELGELAEEYIKKGNSEKNYPIL